MKCFCQQLIVRKLQRLQHFLHGLLRIAAVVSFFPYDLIPLILRFHPAEKCGRNLQGIFNPETIKETLFTFSFVNCFHHKITDAVFPRYFIWIEQFFSTLFILRKIHQHHFCHSFPVRYFKAFTIFRYKTTLDFLIFCYIPAFWKGDCNVLIGRKKIFFTIF